MVKSFTMKHFFYLFWLGFGSSSVILAQAPDNDLCASAIDLSQWLGQGIGQQQTSDTYSNLNATGEPELSEGLEGFWFDSDSSGNDVSVDQSVWFKMQGDGGTYQIMTTNCAGAAFYSNDTQIALYRGSCDSLELVTANDDLMPFWDANYGWYYSWIDAQLVQGDQYFLMVDGYNWNDGNTFQGVAQGSFCLLMTETTNMGDHNDCIGALGIDEIFEPNGNNLSVVGPFDGTPNGSGIGPNENAETLGIECWQDGPSGAGNEDASVWFKFTGDGESYTISHTFCDEENLVWWFGWDSQMALYKGVCGELIPVACAEDFNTDDGQWWAEIGFDSEDGVEYYLRFDGFLWDYNGATWTANGAFCLQAFPGNVNGVNDLEHVELDVFPNPSVGGSVSLSWPGIESVADVAVFDLTGRQVSGLTQVIKNEFISLDLPTGTYVIKMKTATSSASTKLQIIH